MDIITDATATHTAADSERGDKVNLTAATAQGVSLVTALGDEWSQNYENSNTGATLANNTVTFTPTTGTVDGGATTTIFRGTLANLALQGTDWIKTILRPVKWAWDGIALSYTNLGGSNVVVPAVQFSCNLADVTLVDDANAQTFLEAGRTTFTLEAGVTYQFEAGIDLYTSAAATTHTTSTLFAGTATLTDIRYTTITGNHTTALVATTQLYHKPTIVATAAAVNATATSPEVNIDMRGTLRSNAAGTLIPQIQFSAQPTNTPKARNGSFFRIWKEGASTAGSSGTGVA